MNDATGTGTTHQTVDPQADDETARLRAEVERGREQLGDTVAQLAAKADVKARAREKAAEVKLRARAGAVRVRARGELVCGQARDRIAGASPVPLIAVAGAAVAAVGAATVYRRKHTGGRWR